MPHNYPLDKLAEPGLNENAFYDPTNFTYPAGWLTSARSRSTPTIIHDGGALHRVDDFGNIINPMIVEGRVHGGRRGAWGRRCWKAASRRRIRQSCSPAIYMDYTMPRADDLPSFRSTTRSRLARTIRWA